MSVTAPFLLLSVALHACSMVPRPRTAADVTHRSPERRTVDAATWERAVADGEFSLMPLAATGPRREVDCFTSTPEPAPAGSVRLGSAVPSGSSSSLYQSRGGDGAVWIVTQSSTLHVPPGPDGRAMPTPSTHCFDELVALPPGTHVAGSIAVR